LLHVKQQSEIKMNEQEAKLMALVDRYAEAFGGARYTGLCPDEVVKERRGAIIQQLRKMTASPMEGCDD
jgi:hypothetical protein